MTLNQTTPSIGGEWFGKASELLGSADKNLDQVKKSVKTDLEQLKRSTDTAASLYASAEAGFKKDLDEVGVRGDAQNEYLILFKAEWDKQEMGKKSSEILASPELAAMNGFITSIQNLPKLKAIIDSAEPGSNWQGLIKSFASRIPGLSQFLDSGGFDTILTSLGLDFLVKPKKDKPAEKPKDGAATPAAADAKKEDEKKDDKPKDGSSTLEVVPPDFKPGKTLIMGDSNFNVFPANRALRDRMNATGMITRGAIQSSWGLAQAKEKPAAYFKDFEYVAIGFGTNDMSSQDSAETIWARLKEITKVIKEKNPNIKVLLATIPPGKGNEYWASNFAAIEIKRGELNTKIKEAKQQGLIAGVIDLAAKKSEGGVADDKDPESIDKDSRKFGNDPVHAKAEVLADAILRAQYRESKEQKA